MNKITYVFGHGRRKKILQGKGFAKEFFYSYQDFVNDGNLVEIVEMEEEIFSPRGSRKIYKFLDKVLRKLSNLPFFMTEIVTRNNFNIIKKSNSIFFTNDRLAISCMPISIYAKIATNLSSSVLIMGLFSKPRNNIIVKIFQKSLLILFLKIHDNFIFIGKAELEEAKRLFPKYTKKFKYIPFCVDVKFWNFKSKEHQNKTNKNILFVGNDGNRDYEFLVDLSKNLPQYDFKFITNYKFNKTLPRNATHISGSWSKSMIDDNNLRKIYHESDIVVLPLKNTIQPSGQSVTLQALSCGTPVMITKIDGFWDKDSFKNMENIIFIDKNHIQLWSDKLDILFNDRVLYDKLVSNGHEMIKGDFNIEYFYKELKKLILN